MMIGCPGPAVPGYVLLFTAKIEFINSKKWLQDLTFSFFFLFLLSFAEMGSKYNKIARREKR
jgi:hypothetical protein